MKTIKISSKGEINIKAFSKMGASTKRNDDSKIGMFGSGLKYSIAYLLRNNIPFRVFSGYREVEFTTQEEDFRGQVIKSIYINDRETDLTTEMGMDWQAWFIIRELFCNALDEEDGKIEILDIDLKDIEPVEDYTVFYISVNDDFQQIINDWDLYFSEKRKDIIYFDDKFNQIYKGGEFSVVYRKGIRCQYNKTKCLFHYDMSWIKINESRVIDNDWDYKYKMCCYLKKIEDKNVVHIILNTINDYAEKDWYWDNTSDFSDVWLQKIGKKILIPYDSAGFWAEEIKQLKGKHLILPNALIRGLVASFGDKVQVIGEGSSSVKEKKIISELSDKQKFFLEKATSFLKKTGYKVEYPIKIVKFQQELVLGQAENSTIYLADKLFEYGTKKLVQVIIEENEHNKTGFGDETRTFQDYLFNMIISEMEQRIGEYL